MAYRELGVVVIKDVLRRWMLRHSVRSVSRGCRVGRETVDRYIVAAKAVGLEVGGDPNVLTDEVVGAVSALVQVGAPIVHGSGHDLCVRHRDQLVKWHAAGTPGPKLQRLLSQRADVKVPLRTLQRFIHNEVAKSRGPKATCYVADCAPGAELQVDYEQLGPVHDAETGRNRMLHAFVCVAVHSRHMFLYPCWDETTDTTIAALEAAWAFYGGVFAGVIPDNLRAVVIKADPVNPVFQEAFVEYSLERGFVIGPARVRKPQDKGRVESGVGYTQGDFLGGETWDTLADWRSGAVTWCLEIAGMRRHGTTFEQPLLHFERVEREVLLPAPTSHWDIPHWANAKVGRDNRIRVENAWYRVPAGHIGEEMRVRIDRTTLRVQHKNQPLCAFGRVETGKTGGVPPPTAVTPQDSIASRDPTILLGQSQQHGEHVAQVVARLLGRGLWFSQVRKVYYLFNLCDKYGKAVVDAACEKLLAVDDDDVSRVQRVVELGLERQPSVPKADVPPESAPSKYARDPGTWRISPGTEPGAHHAVQPSRDRPTTAPGAAPAQAGAAERDAA